MSFGGYPALSLKDAQELREQARELLAKGVNPHSDRKRKRHAIVLAGDHTFKAVYDKRLAHRSSSLENEGRQSTPKQIERVFKKDVFPLLRHMTIYDVTRAHLLDIIGRVEERGSFSVAEKLRTWFTQLFTYASVVVPDMGDNPSKDLDVVAMPLPPVENNPFLRMSELPMMLQTLRKYRGRLRTQLGIRLLMPTGAAPGELRYATPDQFDMERGLWIIPVVRLKQRKQLTKKSASVSPTFHRTSCRCRCRRRKSFDICWRISSRRRSISSPVIGASRAASAKTRSTARSSAWDTRTNSPGMRHSCHDFDRVE